jgi:cyclopropane-fatty-acyl-phospholipid synthase
MQFSLRLLEGGFVPDMIIRRQIRKLVQQRLDEETVLYSDKNRLQELMAEMRESPLAIETRAANEQHYELPPAFFQRVLGSNMKYSCCFWNNSTQGLDEAESASLAITAERAELSDGMDILELGCGWGSLTLFMAQLFPKAHITAVSNSVPQKQFITRRCSELGIENVRIVTADMNNYQPDKHFDRVVSVEMFEHMRNWERLLERVQQWLKPEGKLFIHIFTHKKYTYFYEEKDATDWMSKYFFTGGIMPGEDLLHHLDKHMKVEQQWTWSGVHYQKTAEEWLKNMTRRREFILPVLEETYGRKNLKKWWNYWRVFFMACAELWGYNNGEEWRVSHYLLQPANSVEDASKIKV